MAYVTLVPAYGRDYKNKKEVQTDWDADKDFLINDMSHPYNGKYINKPQASKGDTMMIRFKQLRNVHVIKIK